MENEALNSSTGEIVVGLATLVDADDSAVAGGDATNVIGGPATNVIGGPAAVGRVLVDVVA